MSQRICIVHPAGMGDVVLGLPVANALKRDDPGRRITWVAEPTPAALLRHHPAVDEVVVHRRGSGARGAARLARAFRGQRFDVALNPQFRSYTALPLVLSRAPLRVGFDRPLGDRGARLLLNRRVTPIPGRHAQENLLQLLEPLGVPAPDPVEWRITFTEAERVAQSAFLREWTDGRSLSS